LELHFNIGQFESWISQLGHGCVYRYGTPTEFVRLFGIDTDILSPG
jgi:hypothetical protein